MRAGSSAAVAAGSELDPQSACVRRLFGLRAMRNGRRWCGGRWTLLGCASCAVDAGAMCARCAVGECSGRPCG